MGKRRIGRMEKVGKAMGWEEKLGGGTGLIFAVGEDVE